MARRRGRSRLHLVEVDRRVARRKRAAAQVEFDRANLEKADTDNNLDIQATEAKVAVAKVAIRQSEINLSYCRIYSPIDGCTGEVKVQPGDLIGPSASRHDPTELTTVQQLDPIGVESRSTHASSAGLPSRLKRDWP